MLTPEIEDFDPATAVSVLRDHGALLVRDSSCALEDFVAATGKLMASVAHHSVATGERASVGDAATHVVTVNRGHDAIPLHRESSFLPTQPDLLALYCRKPPAEGGQTLLCDGVALATVLPVPIRRLLDTEQLVWRFRMPPERWTAVLNCTSREEAAARIRLLMKRAPLARYDFAFDDDYLDGTYRAPFLLPTFWQGLPALSTSVLGYYYRAAGPYVAKSLHQVTLSDGSPVPDQILEAIAAHGETLTTEHNWRRGDVLLIDNSHVMHGRRSVTDPARDIVVRMGHYLPELAGSRHLR
jgi:hypothetical protein